MVSDLLLKDLDQDGFTVVRDVLQSDEGAGQEPRSGEQDDDECELCNNDPATNPLTGAAGSATATAVAQRLAQSCARRLDRRHQAEHESGGQRRDEGHQQHRWVESDRRGARNVGRRQRAQGTQPDFAEPESDGAANQ